MNIKNDEEESPDLLIQRIEKIEDELSKAHKRWYQNPSIVVSILALTISSALALYNIIKDSRDENWSKRQELTEVISILTETGQAMANLQIEALSEPRQNDAVKHFARTLNNQRYILLSSADRLVRVLGDRVFPVEFAVLGASYQQNQDYDKAETYYLKITNMWESILYFHI